jgi:hypothetical protein
MIQRDSKDSEAELELMDYECFLPVVQVEMYWLGPRSHRCQNQYHLCLGIPPRRRSFATAVRAVARAVGECH